ncbi:hypothetical protein IOD13_03610 [Brevibacterium casei]|nr:hypothetical protein [Brevibacterium casei]
MPLPAGLAVGERSRGRCGGSSGGVLLGRGDDDCRAWGIDGARVVDADDRRGGPPGRGGEKS